MLQPGLDGGERTRWHALYAAFRKTLLEGHADPDFESLLQLADHHNAHNAAGHTAESYRW
ncbi:hypothetical protein [Specibacter sp. NPDC078692]|uniref:hypothetical protein n=1 Tax=Specibacter sp. NPDC078692 TaxID=3155818 RepID=UPI00344A0DAB